MWEPIYNLMKISFYKHDAQAGCVGLLRGVNHAQPRTNKSLSIGDCCQGDVKVRGQCASLRDVLAQHTSHLEYTLFEKQCFNQIVAMKAALEAEDWKHC